jgi:transposase-like protein
VRKSPVRMMRFSENEKRKILREGRDRSGVKKVCERNGISIRTYYRWQAMVAQQEESRMAEIRTLQQQNERLKVKFAELSLDYQTLRAALIADVKCEC